MPVDPVKICIEVLMMSCGMTVNICCENIHWEPTWTLKADALGTPDQPTLYIPSAANSAEALDFSIGSVVKIKYERCHSVTGIRLKLCLTLTLTLKSSCHRCGTSANAYRTLYE